MLFNVDVINWRFYQLTMLLNVIVINFRCYWLPELLMKIFIYYWCFQLSMLTLVEIIKFSTLLNVGIFSCLCDQQVPVNFINFLRAIFVPTDLCWSYCHGKPVVGVARLFCLRAKFHKDYALRAATIFDLLWLVFFIFLSILGIFLHKCVINIQVMHPKFDTEAAKDLQRAAHWPPLA